MEDLNRAKNMERVLRDGRGEGNSVPTLARRYSLSEESINNVLGISPEAPESRASLKKVGFWKRLGF
jgi:Mor family transcriptional regulator